MDSCNYDLESSFIGDLPDAVTPILLLLMVHEEGLKAHPSRRVYARSSSKLNTGSLIPLLFKPGELLGAFGPIL